MREQQIDIWEAARNAQAVCITTNGTVKSNGRAVMGRGVALEAAGRWPKLPSMLGQWLSTTGGAGPHLFVIPKNSLRDQPFALVCFPVKFEWNMHAAPILVAQSIKELVDSAEIFGWQRVVLPRPGCGNGSLDWDRDVKPLCAPLDDRFLVVWK